MLMIFVQWILHKTQNCLFQYHLGVQLDLCIVGALPPIQHFPNNIRPSMTQNVLWHPCSLLHRSPLICFWLLSGPTVQVFPIICPLLLELQVSSLLVAQDFFFQIVMLQWVTLFPLQHGRHYFSVQCLPYTVFSDSSTSMTHKNFDFIILTTGCPVPAILFLYKAWQERLGLPTFPEHYVL